MPAPIYPPVPTAPSGTDAQQWRDYIAHLSAYNYAVALDDARARYALDQQRAAGDAARAASSEKHAQAQADTAAAMQAGVEAQQKLAIAMTAPVLYPAPTDEELVRQFMKELAQAGITGAQALSQALDNLRVLKIKYPPPPPRVTAPA